MEAPEELVVALIQLGRLQHQLVPAAITQGAAEVAAETTADRDRVEPGGLAAVEPDSFIRAPRVLLGSQIPVVVEAEELAPVFTLAALEL